MGGNQRYFPVDSEEQRRAKEKAEFLLLKMTVIQVQIRSQVPGVMKNGTYTIPVQVAVNRKWTDVFMMDKVQVKMDPVIHQLVGRSKEIDINTEVFEYYRQFHRNRSVYAVDINPRPPPKLLIKRKSKAATKSRARANKRLAILEAEKDRTRSQRRETVTVTSKTESRGLKRLNNTRPRRVAQESVNAVARPQEQEELPATSSVFRIPAVPSQSHSFAQPEKFVFRDESTMAGDVRYDGEADVKTGILRYMSEHCSNRDMLEIRQELTALKQQKKFQSLNRLIRFTSGFLQNAFVDDHN